METASAISADAAENLLGKAGPLSADEVVKLLRFLKRANEETSGKVRQLKSEVGRMAHK